MTADGWGLACDTIYIDHSDTLTVQMITASNIPLGLEIVYKTTVFIRILTSAVCTCAYKTTSSNVLGLVYTHTLAKALS